MAKKSTLSKELKGLGNDLVTSFRAMLQSQEFKGLENEIKSSLKSISKNLIQTAKAAGKSKATVQLKNRLQRVVQEGTKEGKIQARKAQISAAKSVRQIRESLKKKLPKPKVKKNIS